MDYAKTLKLLFRVGGLNLPEGSIPAVERRKMHRCALVAKQYRVELIGGRM